MNASEAVLNRIDKIAHDSLANTPNAIHAYYSRVREEIVNRVSEDEKAIKKLCGASDEDIIKLLHHQIMTLHSTHDLAVVAGASACDGSMAPAVTTPVYSFDAIPATDSECPEETTECEQARPVCVVPALLLLICVIAFICEAISSGSIKSINIDTLIALGGRVNELIAQDGQVWRLITPIFLHGGIVHLVLNMGVLAETGTLSEPLFGKLRFFLIFLMAGFAGTTAGFAFAAPEVVSIGASGAIFGIFGSLLYVRMISSNQFHSMVDSKAFYQTIGANLLIGIVGFFFIDNYAHIGGLIGGYLAAECVGLPQNKFGLRNIFFSFIYTAVILFLLIVGFAHYLD